MDSREFDLVLFGATGFVGRLTAAYLADRVAPGQRVALAGRDLHNVLRVRRGISAGNSEKVDFACVQADSLDPVAMDNLARRTRVIASTIGPYQQYGAQLVRACAAAGTDYLDLTGEPEFVDTTYLECHASAERTGARLVHACGFDSVPHDLGAYYTVAHLPPDAAMTVRGYVEASGSVSGGTAHSALNAFAHLRRMATVTRERRRVESRPIGRSARAVTGRPHRAQVTGGWAVPLPTIDPQIVARSARALDRYGPDFTYSHFASVPRLALAVGGAAGIAGVVGLAQLPPARRALMARLPAGSGPDDATRERSWFRVTFVGESEEQRVVTRVSGGDPGYGETARMFGEAALCLAFDPGLPDVAGQVTTVQAMGDALLDRVRRSGLRVETLTGPVQRDRSSPLGS